MYCIFPCAGRRIITLAAITFISVTSSADTHILIPLGSSVGGRTVIVNGKIADPKDYPSSFQSGKGRRICTWFLVGEQALIGAAHCVVGRTREDPVDDVVFVDANGRYTALCKIPEMYWKDRSQDWTICKVTPAFLHLSNPTPNVAGFEVLAPKNYALSEGMVLEIGGFGCTKEGEVVKEDYIIGRAKVVGLPPTAHVLGSSSPTPNSVKIRQFPSLLCEGDSGGPTFFYQKNGDRVHRLVVGVNSSTAIAAGASYVSSTTTSSAHKFFYDWALSEKVKICGIHLEYARCRPFIR